MHRPSIPGDLVDADLLWAYATLLYLFDAESDLRMEEDLLWCLDGGGGSWWWQLRRLPGGRAVFWGQDADGSHGHLRDDPVDFLAGGPEWLPWEELRHEARGYTIGYLYWWQEGAWSRAPYPDDLEDDGLEMSAAWAGGVAALHDKLDLRPGTGSHEAVSSFLDRALARTVDEDVVRRLLGAARDAEDGEEPLDLGTAMEAVRRAGFTGA